MTYEELIDSFLSYEKSLLVSPAGYGKTYTIVECIKKVDGKSLILTHTHAGIAAIKKRLKIEDIDTKKYQVETITSYAQKYVKSYYIGNDTPKQDAKEYWPFVLTKAEELFRNSNIKDVIKNSYVKLFVDEYQDCTISQHKMIYAISEILPTHILGDPLQGIMDFNEELVNFENDLNEFIRVSDLETPHRWNNNGNNRELGIFLKGIREKLYKCMTNTELEDIDLKNISNPPFYFIKTTEEIDSIDFKIKIDSLYRKSLNKLINNPDRKPEFNNLLILVPEYIKDRTPKGKVNERAKLKKTIDYTHQLFLLEAIDDESFYSIARTIDDLIKSISTTRIPIKKIREKLLNKFFNKTEISEWINNQNVVKNRQGALKEKSDKLNNLVDSFITVPTIEHLYNLIKFLHKDLRFKVKRHSLFKSILDCLLTEDAEKSVYDAMVKQRNRIRRVGRKIDGKCIGTTALTKGLEFDTVAILDAHNFDCPKNLYVALTRASKKLIIFSKNEVLTPYKIS